MRPWDRRLLRSRVVHGLIAEATLLLAILAGCGPGALVVFVLQAVLAVRFLETVNYFEHWGLVRTGKRVRTIDAWDTDSWFTYYTLVGLSRHADHHVLAARPYQQLRFLEGSPKLPYGYFANRRWVGGARRYARRLSCSVRLRGDAYATPPPPGVEERWITTADGVRLHAWYARASRQATTGSTTLLWAHGNGVSIARRPHVLQALTARGLDVLAFDYRGCGRSTGRPSEAGLYRDAVAAYDSERARGVPPSRIVAFGESLGGVVALDLATRRPCAGVAVVSTLTHVRDLWPGVGALSRSVRLDALERIRRLHIPVLVAHGDRDQTIRLEIGHRLFAAANPPKTFLRVAGVGHYTVLQNVGLLDAPAAFAHEIAGETTRGGLR